MLVRKDSYGLYVSAGGYVSRPLLNPTKYKEGDDVKTHHFGGSVLAGVGKGKNTPRGKYEEFWITTGYGVINGKVKDIMSPDREIRDKDIKEQADFYKEYALQHYGHLVKKE